MQILHVGSGAFFRAHQAWYLNRLITQGDDSWSIIAGSIRDDTAEILRSLAAQDGAYTLEMVAPDGERTYEKITSIRRVVPFAADCAELVAAGAEPDVRIVSFTVTEAGYCLDAQHRLDAENADLRADIAGEKRTIYGVIAAILARRREVQSGPVTILNCDNLRHNGDRFHESFTAFLQMAGNTELASWIATNVSFPNSMVDRITPRPSEELPGRVKAATGFDDAVPVMSESFAQWVIEDNFVAGRPAWEQVGAQLVKSVLPFEEAKIRILNASHSCFAWFGTLRGLTYIHEGVAVHDIFDVAHRFITNDVIPALGPNPLNLEKYRDLVLRRFSSAEIKDTNQRVAADSYAKIPGFIVPTLRDLHQRGESFEATAKLLGLFFSFLRAYHAGQLPWEYHDAGMDPKSVETIFASPDPLHAFCQDHRLFGELTAAPEIEAAIRRAETEIVEQLVLAGNVAAPK